MRRRDFMGLLGGALAASPHGGVAQVSTRRPRVAFLSGVSFGSDTVAAVFAQRLQELGSVAGRDMEAELRTHAARQTADLFHPPSAQLWPGEIVLDGETQLQPRLVPT